jgi:hypothetical protein
VRILDETNAEEAMREPEAFRAGGWRPVAAQDGFAELALGPYAIARIDVE